MSEKNGHITQKVILGYVVLIGLAFTAIVYIYNVVERMAYEEPDTESRRKIYLVTNTLALLYENEAQEQLIGMPQADFTQLDSTFNKVVRNMDLLQSLLKKQEQKKKTDSIKKLLIKKRQNTLELIETWNKANTERLYAENINKIISLQDTITKEQTVREHIEIKRDSVQSPVPKSKGFFKRLAEVFVPVAIDTNVIVNTTRHIRKDTLINAYSPSDTIISVLKSLQDSVSWQRKQITDVLLIRAANLRYDNSVITSKVNQMLRNIEEDEIESTLEHVNDKQGMIRSTARLIGGIAIISVLIAILFLLVISKDVSRSKYYRIQLEKAKQYAEDLLSSRERLMLTISHDIRAPLSSIIGFIDLAQRLQIDGRIRYYLENMAISSDHILSLVNDLLDFQRLDSGQVELHAIPFNRIKLFNDLYASFKPLADKKKLDFTLSIDKEKDDYLYIGDPIRIRQIVGNLVSNAIKFTRKGQVVISVKTFPLKENEQSLIVIVSDAGPGIPEEKQEKIFEEFSRLAGTETAEGFGVGLSIVKKLTALMKGSISLKSVEGKGSDFTFVLPLKITENKDNITSSAPSIEEIKKYPPASKTINCLLVDDDPSQLALTEEILKKNHIEVTCSSNPYEIVSLLNNLSYDIIITDIQMPGMDGYTLLRRIKESGIPGIKTVPIIALSANIAKEQEHYLNAGFTGFLNKPFTAKDIISLLNRVLGVNIRDVNELKISSILEFAGTDKAASLSILDTFHKETEKSLVALNAAKETADRQQAARLAHKLLPLITMLQENELTYNLRAIEANDPTLPEDDWSALISLAAGRIKSLLEQIKKAIDDRYTDISF